MARSDDARRITAAATPRLVVIRNRGRSRIGSGRNRRGHQRRNIDRAVALGSNVAVLHELKGSLDREARIARSAVDRAVTILQLRPEVFNGGIDGVDLIDVVARWAEKVAMRREMEAAGAAIDAAGMTMNAA